MPDLTFEYFQKLLEHRFTVASEGGAIELRLAECRSIPSPMAQKATRQAFALIFLGPVQPVLPQRTFSLEGGPDGPLEIFMVPVGPDQRGMRYEAVFT